MFVIKELKGEGWQGYINVQPVRDIFHIKNKLRKAKYLYCDYNYNPNVLLNDISEYEKGIKKNFKTKEAQFGIEITLLLPVKNWNTNELIKVVSTFVKMVIQKEKGLKYISYTFKKGKGQYIGIYIYDREYTGSKVSKRYKRDFVINKNTRKVCSYSHPEAIILHKKGDLIIDEEGKTVKEVFKSTKTRIFAFKKEGYNAYIQMFRDYFLQTLLKLNAKIRRGFILQRKNLNKAYNRFAKRIIVANNQLIQYIQNEINYYYNASLRVPDGYDIYKNGGSFEEGIETKLSKDIESLLSKYRNIFLSNVYYFKDSEYKLDGYRCDIVEKNLIMLKNIFNQEIKDLIEVSI